jgi:hypothetical protein
VETVCRRDDYLPVVTRHRATNLVSNSSRITSARVRRAGMVREKVSNWLASLAPRPVARHPVAECIVSTGTATRSIRT